MNGIYAIVYLVKQHTCFLHQFGTVLLDSFASYKGVLVCHGLYLCTIHILDIKCHKSFFCKNEDELREDFVDFVFHTITETIDSYEVWLLISCQPNKMDIPRKLHLILCEQDHFPQYLHRFFAEKVLIGWLYKDESVPLS